MLPELLVAVTKDALMEARMSSDHLDDPALKTLIADMYETMAAADSVGLSAREVGFELRVMVFGFDKNPRYPDEAPVPMTTLINPQIEVPSNRPQTGGRNACRSRACEKLVPRPTHIRYRGIGEDGRASRRRARRGC